MSTKISVQLRMGVWDRHMPDGTQIKGPCFVCKEDISILNFECGHVVSDKDKGERTVNNLRPICSSCNKSMGAMNLFEYMERYFPELYDKKEKKAYDDDMSSSDSDYHDETLCRHDKKGDVQCESQGKYDGYCAKHWKAINGEKKVKKLITVPPMRRLAVWKKYCGDRTHSICYVCREKIHIMTFMCCKVNPDVEDLYNIRPTCGTCYQKIGEDNLFEYMENNYPKHYRLKDEEAYDLEHSPPIKACAKYLEKQGRHCQNKPSKGKKYCKLHSK